jgi:hypothetical protein
VNHHFSLSFGRRQTRETSRAQVIPTQEISHHTLKRTNMSELQVAIIRLLTTWMMLQKRQYSETIGHNT